MAAYSVLMSVYYKENPAYFRAAIQSMIDQTEKTDDFVLVCDGPLTDGLNEVVSWAENLLGQTLTVVRLSENAGLGKALNKGLQYVKNELVARMDSDDISLPDRCAMQLKAFENHPEVSVMSGTVEEFDGDENAVTARRVLPQTHDEILRFARTRNPFNHPCVMFRKSAVMRAGGYRDMHLLEDYYLWVRMLSNGERGMNLASPLLRMRAGFGMYVRRGGAKYFLSQIRLFAYMKKCGMIGSFRFMRCVLIRAFSSLIPAKIRHFLYMKLLRK